MKPPPIKNKEAAHVQITADQILKDAEIHRPILIKPPVQRIMDEK
jgi:crooked neck